MNDRVKARAAKNWGRVALVSRRPLPDLSLLYAFPEEFGKFISQGAGLAKIARALGVRTMTLSLAVGDWNRALLGATREEIHSMCPALRYVLANLQTCRARDASPPVEEIKKSIARDIAAKLKES